MRNRSTALWMVGAFCAAMALAATVLPAFGAGRAGHARGLASHGAAIVCAVLACLLRCRTGRIVWPELSALAAAHARIWACICGRTPRAPRVGRLAQLHRRCTAARLLHFLRYCRSLHVFAGALLGGW